MAKVSYNDSRYLVWTFNKTTTKCTVKFTNLTYYRGWTYLLCWTTRKQSGLQFELFFFICIVQITARLSPMYTLYSILVRKWASFCNIRCSTVSASSAAFNPHSQQPQADRTRQLLFTCVECVRAVSYVTSGWRAPDIWRDVSRIFLLFNRVPKPTDWHLKTDLIGSGVMLNMITLLNWPEPEADQSFIWNEI